jgi:hypothetical protein
MPSTLNPACPLCGLRFVNKPLLDLHLREDHRENILRAQSGCHDPAKIAQPPAPTGSRTETAWRTRHRGSPTGRPPAMAGSARAPRAVTALRGALNALRLVNGKARRVRGGHRPGPRIPAPPAGFYSPPREAVEHPTRDR